MSASWAPSFRVRLRLIPEKALRTTLRGNAEVGARCNVVADPVELLGILG